MNTPSDDSRADAGASKQEWQKILVWDAPVRFFHWLENLIKAMISGRKSGRPDEALRTSWRSIAAIYFARADVAWLAEWRG